MGFLWKHFWVGISKMMLVVYFALAIVIVLDYRRLNDMGLSWSNVWELTSLNQLSGQYLILLILLFAVITPMIFTSVKFLFRQQISGRFGETPKPLKFFLLFLHIATFGMLGLLYCLAPSAQRLSGRQLFADNTADFAYRSFTRSGVDSISIYSLLVSAAVWGFTLFASVRTTGQTFGGFSEIYNLWLELAVPEGDLYPLQRKICNFNAGAISPEIRHISRRMRRIEPSYQKDIPGSRDAAERLREMAADCKRKIFELLAIDNSQFRYQIEFHSGTSRSLELALARLPKPLVVLISPFEHPAELAVAEWLQKQSNVSLKTIEFNATLLQADWEQQQRQLTKELETKIDDPAKHYVLLISEVCYTHGEVIPLTRIMNDLRIIRGKRLSFVIDGSHAVGNIATAFANGKLELGEYDSYVFGAHKWLLSPEPCGVVISSSNTNIKPARAYDAWGHDLPITTVGFHRIGSFVSSLHLLLEEHRFKNFALTAAFMKERFLNLPQIQKKFFLVGKSGNQIGSNMIAIKPTLSTNWSTTTPQDLENDLYRLGINCKVIDVGDAALWVRISFSYFNTIADVRMLGRVLNKSIGG